MTTDLTRATKGMPFDVLIDRSRGLLDGILAPDLVGYLPDPGAAPTRENLEHALSGLKTAFPHLQYTLDDGIIPGGHVAHCLSVTGTVRGDFIWASRTWANQPAEPGAPPDDVVMSVGF